MDPACRCNSKLHYRRMDPARDSAAKAASNLWPFDYVAEFVDSDSIEVKVQRCKLAWTHLLSCLVLALLADDVHCCSQVTFAVRRPARTALNP